MKAVYRVRMSWRPEPGLNVEELGRLIEKMQLEPTSQLGEESLYTFTSEQLDGAGAELEGPEMVALLQRLQQKVKKAGGMLDLTIA